MPAQGTLLPLTNVLVINRIPGVKQARWPKDLPVFAHTHELRDFPLSGVRSLLAESAFRGTNIPARSQKIRLASTDGLNHFICSPAEGRISVRNADQMGVDPPADAVPSFEIVCERAVRLAASFGVSTNEFERNEDGSLHLWRSDRETSRQGGRVKFMRSRTVELARSLAGQTFGSLNDEKVSLELGVDGRLLKFELKWPGIVAVATNRVFTIPQVMDEIRTGQAFSDALNEYPAGGIAQIEVKDIVIDYYILTPRTFSTNSGQADVYPVASLLVLFKSAKGETQEGGMYAPIMESR